MSVSEFSTPAFKTPDSTDTVGALGSALLNSLYIIINLGRIMTLLWSEEANVLYDEPDPFNW